MGRVRFRCRDWDWVKGGIGDCLQKKNVLC